MNVRGWSTLGRCPSLSAGNMTLHAELLAHPDGTRKIYMTRRGDEHLVERNPHGPEITRAVYRDQGDGRAFFLGMYIGKALRGLGLGASLFRYFGDHLEDNDLTFAGTGRIHKPVLALLLKREGFTPRSRACMVELLAQSDKSSDTPTVRVLSNHLPPSAMITGSRHGSFYEVVPPGTYTEVPVDENRVVALHTPYRPPVQIVSEASVAPTSCFQQ